MKITRFAQSCILIETKGKRILIDPGNIQYDESLLKDGWNNIDIILVTHKHKDHCYKRAIYKILEDKNTQLYSSKEVLAANPKLSINIVKEGDRIHERPVTIEVVKAVHGYIPPLKGGNEIFENVGYIIDDGDKRAYHTSDTVSFKNDYKCDVLFIPVSNHGLVMGPWEAALFAKEAEAKLVIPIHLDNPKHLVDLEEVEKEFSELNCKTLEIGESTEF